MVLQRIAGQKNYNEDEYNFAVGKFDRELIKYSGEEAQVGNKKKKDKYLTVQALLDHPYFIKIDTADISSVID